METVAADGVGQGCHGFRPARPPTCVPFALVILDAKIQAAEDWNGSKPAWRTACPALISWLSTPEAQKPNNIAVGGSRVSPGARQQPELMDAITAPCVGVARKG